MTLLDPSPANGFTSHIRIESFKDYAYPELAAFQPWQDGICYNPLCAKPFDPSRDWGMYCCPACERQVVAEMQRWGRRMAWPLLLHRQYKYAAPGTAQADLVRAARRYVTMAQSAWMRERAGVGP
ncbi:hypothetical protein TG4357_02670 [Thalassovita gelatinovora]|uniref:Uncharacterized protein n=1 Tax=Thalassovita gelatinovora TaxID=53501 RepID=A0A0P1FFS0_THAGE|nr:hypothetical protein [Thalassovita gelatinovora]QIZ79795.1 hypothetical protein HFZ77_04515 [Thalassovita gelatinovora]CUH66838.1 hypothetical protein TG4357_02670 [Thalassovita gelatinovora]SEQ43674.1 hypothetical protein SAMN04488043_105207 [Thalassovita gelatinovora]